MYVFILMMCELTDCINNFILSLVNIFLPPFFFIQFQETVRFSPFFFVRIVCWFLIDFCYKYIDNGILTLVLFIPLII